MKKYFRSGLILGLASAMLIGVSACTSQQEVKLAQLAATAQVNAGKACTIIQPTLVDLALIYPQSGVMSQIRDDNAKLCLAMQSLDTSNVANLVNTAIPQLLSAVNASPLDDQKKQTISLALTVASIALANWQAAYGSTTSTTTPATPASAPSAASTPLAGAPLQ